ADAVFTIALTLVPPEPEPTIDAVAAALDSPERPLFLGRKPCLPAAPILLERFEATALREALENAARLDPARSDEAEPDHLAAWWPDGDVEADEADVLLEVTHQRDLTNPIHGGQRLIRHGTIRLREAEHAG